MRKIFFLLVVLFFCNKVQSQPLSKFYNLINGNEYGTKLLLHEDGYFLLTNGICDPGTGNSKGCTSILTVDTYGYFASNHVFVNWFRFAPNFAVQIVNDTIYVFGINEEIWGEKTSWNIYKTNFNGDSLDFFAYEGFDELVIIPESMQIKGDYLYLLGKKYNWWLAKGEYIVVIKMDKQGHKIKEERFYDIAKPDFINLSFDLVQTTDGNFVLSGRSLDSSFDEIIQSFVIKFDDNLEMIWSKGLNRRSFLINKEHLTALNDSSIVVSSGIYVPDIIDKLGNEYKKYELYPSTLHKIDIHGNIVWSDTLWTKRDRGTVGAQKRIIKMITVGNGDIIGCGIYLDSHHNRWGWIFRYSPDGVLKWEKKYEDKRYPNGKSIFYDIKEANNGDIVCTGEMDSNEGWGGNDSYTWLLRVDSMGCFEPGCCPVDTTQLVIVDSIVKTQDPKIKKDEVYIYPNPTRDRITVKMPKSCAICYDCKEVGIKWMLWDMTGHHLFAQDVVQRREYFDVDLSKYPRGLYLLEIIDKGRSFKTVKKVIKE